MSILRRMSDVFQQKVSAAVDKAEDPSQALDLSYQKQLEALQQARRSVADVLTSEKRLELQADQLTQSIAKLQGQARTALGQGQEDLAREALTRAQLAQTQLDGLTQQIATGKQQEQKLEITVQKLQARLRAIRMHSHRVEAQGQFRLASCYKGELDGYDQKVMDAIEAGQAAALKQSVHDVIAFVKSHGVAVADTENAASQVVLPSEDLTLDEAKKIMAGS